MSGLVIELQSDALNNQIKCSDLLRKALVVSKKLGIKSIEEWLQKELNGYPLNDDDVPDYRTIYGQIKVWNPYHGWQLLNFGNPKEAERLSQRKIMQSVGELDSLLDKDNSEGLQVTFPPRIANSLMKGMNVPLQPSLHVPRTEVVKILNHIRNTILEWSLELEKKDIIGEGMTFSKEEKKAAGQITYQITNNIGTMKGSQIQQNSPEASIVYQKVTDFDKIESVLADLKSKKVEIPLSQDNFAELDSDIETISVQSKSPKPKLKIISESLKSIKTILESAAGNVTAKAFLDKIADLL